MVSGAMLGAHLCTTARMLPHTVPAQSCQGLPVGWWYRAAAGKAHRNTVLQGWDPRSTLELSTQLHCAHLARLPGAPYAALSLPLLNRMGEKAYLKNSWVEAKSTLFYPCLNPLTTKCVC